ncbi:hypothetical protein DL95DRAFT_443802 [Leptodontidium sp. 2 PMI_412]|nr:hypothetical protein DL95DRAFT_443802 [Leptodontidium sp. 2 PMI_412]
MALKLGDLPNELLIKIFHRNRLSNDDMCTVARTCKHFSKVVIPLIYSNVKVKRRANDERTFGLIQSITDNPSRAELILKLSFSWSNNGTTFREDQERIVQFLLRRTTRLQILKLKVITMSQYAMPFPVVSGVFLDVNPMTSLRRVEVAYVNITWETMGKFLLLPQMSAVFFTPMDQDPDRIDEHLPQRPADRQSRIEYLAIEGHPKSVQHVHELLRWSDNLRALLFDFGSYTTLNINGPSTLQKFLAPISQTLFFLDLQGCHTDDFHCATVDFSNFPVLKTLGISQSLLFPTFFEQDGEYSVEPYTRNGLYLRLPKKLEDLTVFFDFGSAILDHQYHTIRHNFVNEEYDWIEELAIFKPDFLPNLKRVRFTEHSDANRESHDVMQLRPWSTPKAVKTLFETRDINLKVLIRSYSVLRNGLSDANGAENVVNFSQRRLLELEV